MQESAILGLLAETAIHAGSGRNMGVIDLPMAREAATDYPVVVASSFKGALRDKAQRRLGTADEGQEIRELFGMPDSAGLVLVSDARLLLLPIRSLTGAYRWVTCPHLLERFSRDLQRLGRNVTFEVPPVERGTVLTAGEGSLFLEELQFEITGDVPQDLLDALASVVFHPATRARLPAQVALLSNDDASWFMRNGLFIRARNKLDDNKQSKNLWYEESLPMDTLLYALLVGRSPKAVAAVTDLFAEDPYLQVGGNETVGEGWLAVRVVAGADGGEP